jgi:formylglycine-generating enzyme required for sulfatase activity
VRRQTGAPVRQRLRWMPPGEFQMGSPEDEPGRYADEGPRHRVTIADGFWLFDTPCTQALWQAVMASNPSRFKTRNARSSR